MTDIDGAANMSAGLGVTGEGMPSVDPAGTLAAGTLAHATPVSVARGALEAVLLVVEEPAPVEMIADAVDRPVAEVADALSRLASQYDADDRGFELRLVAGGWRLQTRATFGDVVERFVREDRQARLTQAALETLAIVAYRQPVSRAKVSAIRGVSVDGVMRTLVNRGLVEQEGLNTAGASMYRTTSYFLERLGLNELGDLPNIASYLPDELPDDDLNG